MKKAIVLTAVLLSGLTQGQNAFATSPKLSDCRRQIVASAYSFLIQNSTLEALTNSSYEFERFEKTDWRGEKRTSGVDYAVSINVINTRDKTVVANLVGINLSNPYTCETKPFYMVD